MRAAVRVSLKCLVLLAVSALLWSCGVSRINGDWIITAIVDQASFTPENTSGTPPLPVDSRIEVRCTIYDNYYDYKDFTITSLGMKVAQVECTDLNSTSKLYGGGGDHVELWFSGTTSYVTRLIIDGVFAEDSFVPGRFSANIYDTYPNGVLLGQSQGIFAMNKK